MGARALLAGNFALALALSEVVRAHRESQWVGNDWAAYGGLALGFAAYAVTIFVLGGILSRIPVARPWNDHTRHAAALGVAGLAVAIAVAALSGGTWKGAAFACGVVAAVGVLSVAGSGRRTNVLLGVALLGAIAMVWVASDRFLLDARRVELVTVAAVLWTGLAIVAGAFSAVGSRLRARLHGLAWALAAACAAGPVLWSAWPRVAPASSQPGAPPNVVLLVSDTLRASALGAYGGPARTPNIDALAERGTRFARTYTLAPWTPPTMSSVFTSTYPQGLSSDGGADRRQWEDEIWRYRLNPDVPSLAETFDDAGYKTAAFVSNPMVWSLPGFGRGFDEVTRSHPVVFLRPRAWLLLPNLYGVVEAIAPGAVGVAFNDTTRALEQYATRWLAEQRDGPFLLYVHFMDPHAPYSPPERFRSGEVPWRLFWPFPSRWDWGCPLGGRDPNVTEEEKAFARELYYGEIAHMDEAVGNILSALEHKGVDDSTVVAFVSDHGEELWDHGRWEHGHTVYEELLRVPWVVTGPGVAAQVLDGPVSLIDLTPTLADLAGAEVSTAWRGVSRGGAIHGARAFDPAQAVFVHGTSHKVSEEPLQAVVEGDWKLIRGVRTGTVTLFDLAKDPGEQVDIADQHDAVQTRLARDLDAWLASFPSGFSDEDGELAERREQVMEEMRAIGYLE